MFYVVLQELLFKCFMFYDITGAITTGRFVMFFTLVSYDMCFFLLEHQKGPRGPLLGLLLLLLLLRLLLLLFVLLLLLQSYAIHSQTYISFAIQSHMRVSRNTHAQHAISSPYRLKYLASRAALLSCWRGDGSL